MTDEPREQSPWYCPKCEIWVGWKLDSCSSGHSRPSFPLRYDDVDFDYAHKVSRTDRLRGKIKAAFTREPQIHRRTEYAHALMLLAGFVAGYNPSLLGFASAFSFVYAGLLMTPSASRIVTDWEQQNSEAER